jgi:hypothetical protein
MVLSLTGWGEAQQDDLIHRISERCASATLLVAAATATAPTDVVVVNSGKVAVTVYARTNECGYPVR